MRGTNRRNLDCLLESLLQEQSVSMGKSYQWKEDLMQLVLKRIQKRRDEIIEFSDTERIVKEEIRKLRQEVGKSLDMIENTISNIPHTVLRGGI